MQRGVITAALAAFLPTHHPQGGSETRPFPRAKACYSRPMKQFLTTLAISLLAVPALAADPFTVAKVPVDARAESAIQAQTRAVQTGYIIAAQQLFDRITIESERAQRGLSCV